jgi:hypothetical protein
MQTTYYSCSFSVKTVITFKNLFFEAYTNAHKGISFKNMLDLRMSLHACFFTHVLVLVLELELECADVHYA